MFLTGLAALLSGIWAFPPVWAQVPPPAALLEEARTLSATGEYAASAEQYETYALHYPDHPERQLALVALGDLYWHYLERPERAITTYQQVIDHYFPESPWVHAARLQQGRVLLHLIRPVDAQRTLRRIPLDSPHSEAAQQLLRSPALTGIRPTWWDSRNVLFFLISALEAIYIGIWFSVGKSHPRSWLFWTSFALLLGLLMFKGFLNFHLYTLVRG